MITQDSLYSELEKAKALIDKDEWKYYQLEVLDNFIFHIHNIKGERTRNLTALKIEKYLTLVFDKFNSESTKYEIGKELFPHVWSLYVTYKTEFGFIQKPNYFFLAILSIGLFFLAKLSLNTWVSFALCTGLFALYIFYAYSKIKARKYF